jgi:hypothetical protein
MEAVKVSARLSWMQGRWSVEAHRPDVYSGLGRRQRGETQTHTRPTDRRRHIEFRLLQSSPDYFTMPSTIAACKFVGTTSLGLFTVSLESPSAQQLARSVD